MITLRIGELIMPQFKKALLGLKNQEMGFDTAFKINALIKKIENKILEVEESKFALLKKYCQLDENGAFVKSVDEDGKVLEGSVVFIPETESEFKEKFFEYLNTKIELDVAKIDPNALRDTKVTMSDLEFLDVFLEQKSALKLV